MANPAKVGVYIHISEVTTEGINGDENEGKRGRNVDRNEDINRTRVGVGQESGDQLIRNESGLPVGRLRELRDRVGADWVSPYIHPPLKGVTSRHHIKNRTKRNGVKIGSTNLMTSTRVTPVEVGHEIWSVNTIPRLPGIVFDPKTCPLDQIA
jgi:hypothetical protein